MKLLVIGDPHFKLDNVVETEAMTKDILTIASQTKPDYIACLGDVLDRFATIHVSPLVRAVGLLQQLASLAPLILLIGNHDRPNNSVFCTDQHPFTSLAKWPNTYVIDRPQRIGPIAAVPYVPNGRFQEALDQIDWHDCQVILAHQEFQGAKMGPHLSTTGDPLPLSHPLVISGHIHDYQQPQPNLVYVGTPIQHGYGDNPDKAIYLVTFGSTVDWTKYQLPSVPTKSIVRLTASEAQTYQPPPGKLIKLIIRGTRDELKGLKLRFPNVKVCYDTITDTKPLLVRTQLSYLDNLRAKVANMPYESMWLEQLVSH